MKFENTGFDFDSLVNLIVYKDDFKKFLLDMQNEMRIRRAMEEDPGDRLLIGTRLIDDIMDRMETLESARVQYLENKRKEEEEARAKEEEENANRPK